MTLAEAQEILGDWDELPPPALSLARIQAMLASFLGIKKRRPGAPLPEMHPMAVLGTGDVHAGLGGPAILDFAALKARSAHG
jgi:hypothetical protein